MCKCRIRFLPAIQVQAIKFVSWYSVIKNNVMVYPKMNLLKYHRLFGTDQKAALGA